MPCTLKKAFGTMIESTVQEEPSVHFVQPSKLTDDVGTVAVGVEDIFF